MTAAIDPEKFVVFSRHGIEELKEYFRRNPHFEEMLNALEKARVHDAVVLRKQDIHTAGALHAYAASVFATHEVLTKLSNLPSHPDVMQGLLDIVDFMSGQADEASRIARKIPTI